MARVPNYVTETVAFLAAADAPDKLRGTAFLVGYPLIGWDRDRKPPQSLDSFVGKPVANYLVTARHVIERIREQGASAVTVRLNSPMGGTQPVEIPLAKWVLLPDDPQTGRYQDVAACHFDPREFEVRHINLSWSALPSRIDDADIGIGDDVFFPGLFQFREGVDKNLPILRKGTIAAMVDWLEPITVKTPSGVKQMAAHLIETRSIGGLSGSPVFAHPAGLRDRLDGQAVMKSHGHLFLLGLMSGHWDQRMDESGESVNTGIGWVTPVEKIVDVLDMDEFKPYRAAAVDMLHAKTAATMDGTDLHTGEAFLSDLRRVTRQLDDQSEKEES